MVSLPISEPIDLLQHNCLVYALQPTDRWFFRHQAEAGDAFEQVPVTGTLRADERVAALLLDLSDRLTRRGYAGNEFNLRLTRDDMGSFLGITLETVSRTLSRFQAKGLIDANGKLIQILDFNGLRAI